MEQSIEYKITVTRIQKNVPYTEKEYEVVSDVESPRSTGVGTDRERKYDYVDKHTTKDVDTKVFEQTLTDIDLGGLAVFVNTPKANDGSQSA